MNDPICFCCGKEVECAIHDIYDKWQAPFGLHFEDRGNYGSTVHDSYMVKAKYEIVICDDCLKKHWDRGRLVKMSGLNNWA